MNTNTNTNNIPSSKFAQGVFLELYDQGGSLGTPMWLSLREKPVLTKQINQASCFESGAAALFFLSTLDTADLVSPGQHLTISARTYNAEVHKLFWDRMRNGIQEVQEDYSYYLIDVQQKLEQLNMALINGPEKVARALPREILCSLMDLSIAVDRHLNK